MSQFRILVLRSGVKKPLGGSNKEMALFCRYIFLCVYYNMYVTLISFTPNINIILSKELNEYRLNSNFFFLSFPRLSLKVLRIFYIKIILRLLLILVDPIRIYK